MKRGSFAVCLALGTLLLGPTGCKQPSVSHEGFVRHQSQLDADSTTDEKKDGTDAELTKASRSILEPNRRSGAWSSEARAIEADLNVK